MIISSNGPVRALFRFRISAIHSKAIAARPPTKGWPQLHDGSAPTHGETPMDTSDRTSPPLQSKAPPRVRVPLVLIALYWAVILLLPALQLPIYATFFSKVIAAGLLILLFFGWWLLGNRQVPLRERIIAFVVVVVGAFITEAA